MILRPMPDEQVFRQDRAGVRQGPDRQPEAQVVVSGQQMQIGAACHQAVQRIQHVQVRRALVQTISTDNDLGSPTEGREQDFMRAASYHAGRKQRAQEPVGIGMRVGDKDDRLVRPLPGSMFGCSPQARLNRFQTVAGMVLMQAPGLEIARNIGQFMGIVEDRGQWPGLRPTRCQTNCP